MAEEKKIPTEDCVKEIIQTVYNNIIKNNITKIEENTLVDYYNILIEEYNSFED